MTTEETLIYNFILDNELTTQEALDLATSCSGYNVETLNYVIYYFTGYHDIEQLHECEPEGLYFSDEVLNFYGLEAEEEPKEE